MKIVNTGKNVKGGVIKLPLWLQGSLTSCALLMHPLNEGINSAFFLCPLLFNLLFGNIISQNEGITNKHTHFSALINNCFSLVSSVEQTMSFFSKVTRKKL